jgi:hypothetical protein
VALDHVSIASLENLILGHVSSLLVALAGVDPARNLAALLLVLEEVTNIWDQLCHHLQTFSCDFGLRSFLLSANNWGRVRGGDGKNTEEGGLDNRGKRKEGRECGLVV